MYAIINILGKQYKVEKDRWLLVPKMEKEEGDSLELDQVMMFHDGKKAVVGKPYVKNVTVQAKVLQPLFKDKKIVVFKYKKRKDYRRKQGHRQQYTKIMIEDIKKTA